MARVPTGAYWEAAAALLALGWAVEEVLVETLVLPPAVAEDPAGVDPEPGEVAVPVAVPALVTGVGPTPAEVLTQLELEPDRTVKAADWPRAPVLSFTSRKPETPAVKLAVHEYWVPFCCPKLRSGEALG